MKYYGFSNIGKYHIDKNIPCQDFHLIVEHESGFIAVIADGVSSSQYSDVASKIASEAFIFYAKKEIKEGMSGEIVIAILKQAFTYSLQTLIDHIDTQGHKKSQYDTTLTGIFFSKSFTCIAHSGDGGVIGLKPNGLFVSLTEKQNIRDEEGAEYVTPLADVENWKFYTYSETFARILLATDGIYDIFFPHLLKYQDNPIYIKLIHRFMNSKGLNQSLKDLNSYKEKVINDIQIAQLTDDDMTCVLLIDDNLTIERQPEDYYADPNWEMLSETLRGKIYPPQTEHPYMDLPNDEKNPTAQQERLSNSIDTNNLHNGFFDNFNKFIQHIQSRIFSLLNQNQVFDKNQLPIKINSNCLLETSSLRIFPLNKDDKKVIYYYKKLEKNDEIKLTRFLEKAFNQTTFNGIIFPQELVYNSVGNCIGFITQAMGDYTSLSLILEQFKHQDTPSIRSLSVILARNLSLLSSFLQHQCWVVTFFSPTDFYIESKSGFVFLLDPLKVELSEKYEALLNTRKSNLEYVNLNQLKSIDFQDTTDRFDMIEIDIVSNNFSLSVIIFQLLMRGFHPYFYLEDFKGAFINNQMRVLLGNLQAGNICFLTKDLKWKPNTSAPALDSLPTKLYQVFSSIITINSVSNKVGADEWYKLLVDFDSYNF
jgi:serine/threonine protein phosphatase PrpC